MSEIIEFTKNGIGNCKFIQYAIFCKRFVRTVLTDIRYIISIILCQHCDEQQFPILCTLQDFLSSKVRFIHTSTVTRLHSCTEKNTRALRIHLVTYFSGNNNVSCSHTHTT